MNIGIKDYPKTNQEIIDSLKFDLYLDDNYLAYFLGVTTKSLNLWKHQPLTDLSSKIKRLIRLYDVIEYLKSKDNKLSAIELRYLLNSGKIDLCDAEDGSSIILIGYVRQYSESNIWKSHVDSVYENLKTSIKMQRKIDEI